MPAAKAVCRFFATTNGDGATVRCLSEMGMLTFTPRIQITLRL